MKKYSPASFFLIFFTILSSACTLLEPRQLEPSATPTLTSTPTPTIVWFPPTPTRPPLTLQTVAPTATPFVESGEVILTDSFNSPTDWQTQRSAAGSVAFGKNEITVAISSPKTSLSSLREGVILEDFYMEITANPSLCRGSDSYGVLFRAATTQDGYRFALACTGQVRLERLKGGRTTALTAWLPSGQVPPGSPLIIRLGVWVKGKEIRLFVNGIEQLRMNDPVWTSGGVGVFARSAGESPLTVNYSNMVIRHVHPEISQSKSQNTPSLAAPATAVTTVPGVHIK